MSVFRNLLMNRSKRLTGFRFEVHCVNEALYGTTSDYVVLDFWGGSNFFYLGIIAQYSDGTELEIYNESGDDEIQAIYDAISSSLAGTWTTSPNYSVGEETCEWRDYADGLDFLNAGYCSGFVFRPYIELVECEDEVGDDNAIVTISFTYEGITYSKDVDILMRRHVIDPTSVTTLDNSAAMTRTAELSVGDATGEAYEALMIGTIKSSTSEITCSGEGDSTGQLVMVAAAGIAAGSYTIKVTPYDMFYSQFYLTVTFKVELPTKHTFTVQTSSFTGTAGTAKTAYSYVYYDGSQTSNFTVATYGTSSSYVLADKYSGRVRVRILSGASAGTYRFKITSSTDTSLYKIITVTVSAASSGKATINYTIKNATSSAVDSPSFDLYFKNGSTTKFTATCGTTSSIKANGSVTGTVTKNLTSSTIINALQAYTDETIDASVAVKIGSGSTYTLSISDGGTSNSQSITSQTFGTLTVTVTITIGMSISAS